MRDMGLRASVEPSADLKIQLDVKKNSMTSYQEIYRIDSTGLAYGSIGQSRLGSYKTSILTINTAFKNNSSINSTVFQQFEENIGLIQDRFTRITGNSYETQSQDVLIPAFWPPIQANRQKMLISRHSPRYPFLTGDWIIPA
ncbi:MAG: hypothetical protein U5K54_00935 [Cytophagales bacterium]|nr:hypothetical protein [Cytophagales bacterium]